MNRKIPMKGTWRIKIKWGFVSPTLRVASGKVHLDRINSSISNYQVYESHEWEVKVKDSSTSFSAYPSNTVTPQMKDIIDVMVKSYFAGLVIDKTPFMWLEKNDSDYNNDYQI